ncbi:MAG: aconitate hydratase AcnA, partial [Gammaproteobacteria bacterium]
VERYAKAQGLFRGQNAPRFTEVLELDLSEVEPSLAGPKRPQDRVPLKEAKGAFLRALTELYGREVEPREDENPDYARWLEEGGNAQGAYHPRRHDLYRHLRVPVKLDPEEEVFLSHGSLAIAAITSCTNTSNPSVMLGAGILAKKAVERGLVVRPWVKTSLAPGSKVVTRYLEAAGLLPFLEALRFHVVGYGCTTCIGNSGPLPPPVAGAIDEHDLVVCAVLSGNRNFEGRINPKVLANYLASPPLVVAYAIAGTLDIDMTREPLAHDPNGEPVYLRDLWPTPGEIQEALSAVSPEMFEEAYARVFEGSAAWQAIPSPQGLLYAWDPESTYIQEPPFFKDLAPEPPPIQPIRGARVLALLGDSVTTDHISPAGAIPVDSPAGQYLLAKGVRPEAFNSYGARRGNHEVMVRGTFANIRLRNLLAPGTEGGYTLYFPTGEVTTIFEAAMGYRKEGIPLIVLAGKEYGTGSSRDWAAKGTRLLGVRAVIAESYERIHRANLVGMGVLPLQFLPGQSWKSLGLTGREVYDIDIPEDIAPGQTLEVRADGRRFEAIARLDSPVEVDYYRHGGILTKVLREMMAS